MSTLEELYIRRKQIMERRTIEDTERVMARSIQDEERAKARNIQDEERAKARSIQDEERAKARKIEDELLAWREEKEGREEEERNRTQAYNNLTHKRQGCN